MASEEKGLLAPLKIVCTCSLNTNAEGAKRPEGSSNTRGSGCMLPKNYVKHLRNSAFWDQNSDNIALKNHGILCRKTWKLIDFWLQKPSENLPTLKIEQDSIFNV